jgi:predicted component of type VI protein secretion system
MNRAEIEDMASEQLVERFATLALAQDEALLMDDIAKVNRLYRQLKEIEGELKAREGDQRRALLSLYDHPNAQVRLKAVKATLAVAPLEARRQLQIIADSREYPQAGEAGMSIRNLDQGIFKPT